MPESFQPKDTALPLILFLVLFVIVAVLPPLAVFVGVLSPIPLIVLYLQRGSRTGLVLVGLVPAIRRYASDRANFVSQQL